MPTSVWIVAVLMAVTLLEIMSGFWVMRRLGSVFTVALIHMELAAVGLVRRLHPPKHVILGECIKCGTCCESIVANPPRFLKRGFGARAYAAFHRLTHNFRWVGRGGNDEFIFSCGHLRADNRCGIYWRRPLICRTYPVLPYYDAPRVLPQCSYRVASRVASKMQTRASLPILNPQTAVFHPTPLTREELESNYELVEMIPDGPQFPARDKEHR